MLLTDISVALRFVKDQFDDYRESTIGAAFLTQTIALDESTPVGNGVLTCDTHEQAVARLARLVVPALADWAVVTLVDDDTVDLTNLQRQVMHGTSAIGRHSAWLNTPIT